jgi:hypothetical protein
MRRFSKIPVVFAVLLFLVGCEKEKLVDSTADKLPTIALDQDISLAGSVEFCQPSTAPPASSVVTSLTKSVGLLNTVFNTDFVSAGRGNLRNVGSGTIVLSGVSGTVTKAYLYWHGPTNSTVSTGNPITVNSTSVTGTNIGFSSDNCWGYLNSQAFRADVTALVQATGNGNYSLSGFGGMNPNGASLIVFFDDGDNTNNRDVVIFDGNDSNIYFPGISGNPLAPMDPIGWNILLSGINYTSGTASMQLHVADGQQWVDAPLVLNSQTLAPGPAVFSGISVPPGNDQSYGLWDIKSYSVTSYLTPGPNSLNLTTGQYSDCLALIVALVDLPAGAAPSQNGPPVANAGPDQTVECAGPAGTTVSLNGTASSDPDGDPLTFLWSAPGITFSNSSSPTPSAAFPMGTTTVTLTVKDPSGLTSTDVVVIKVEDTKPPVLSCSVTNGSLWPPNHNLVNVGFSATASDVCDPAPALSVKVYSDEEDEEETGDGNHSPDAKFSSGALRLRAERKGDADGRVYLIVVTATDASGNTAHHCCTVVVPHSQSAAAIASVNAQAAAAKASCTANGSPLTPYVVGDGPTIGPKQ